MKLGMLTLLGVLVMSPLVSLYPEPPQRDVPAEVQSARRGLEGAYNDLEHAGGQWGGHRVAAMKHIQQAMAELNEAEKWAREHHDIR